MAPRIRFILLWLVVLGLQAGGWNGSLLAAPAPQGWFQIRVVDDRSGRGVPLVELETVNHLKFVTDSQGAVAFFEPGLMDQPVFFHVRSHGYEFPKDGFGYAGKTLTTTTGGRAELKIKRLNIAERLYRVTGGGLYVDSILTGEPVPLTEPLLNGQVLGQDTVMTVRHRGKIFWFFGDTNRPRYPLGHFGTSGATSDSPESGGLDPARGVDLHYFTDSNGFSRPMIKLAGEGPVWVHGTLTVADPSGRERIVTHYMRMKSLGQMLEQGLAVYDDTQEKFEKLVELNLAEKWRRPQGHPVQWNDGTADYFYFPAPYANVRVRADWLSLTNVTRYEALTCIENDGAFNATTARVARSVDGAVRYSWRTNAEPLDGKMERALIDAGKLPADAARCQLADVDTGQPVAIHADSITWNEFRKRWLLIGVQVNGSSYLGEVWLAEAESLTGPWRWARKIVTHNRYTFYNPTQHPFFDQDGGRMIYFEGTYTEQFSGNPVATPRYDYNQIMYRVDLADPRLGLPLTRP